MIRVGIVGGTGYTGVELLRILASHPQVRVEVITSRSEEGVPVAEMFPNLRGHYDLAYSVPDVERLAQCDLVFFATPHGGGHVHGAGAGGAGCAGHRSGSGLPHQGCGPVGKMVSPGAQLP